MPAWTYSFDPSSSPLNEVRFLIADTDQTRAWTLYDAEISYAINLHSGPNPQVGENFLAAAVCAETILGKFKIIAQSKSVGDLSISYGNQFTFYKDLAITLRNRAALQVVKPYVGGISRSDKEARDQDSDRLGTAVKVDGMSYASPINTVDDSTSTP